MVLPTLKDKFYKLEHGIETYLSPSRMFNFGVIVVLIPILMVYNYCAQAKHTKL
jgi:hypothetical protein